MLAQHNQEPGHGELAVGGRHHAPGVTGLMIVLTTFACLTGLFMTIHHDKTENFGDPYRLRWVEDMKQVRAT